MNELERGLVELGQRLELPAEPDVTGAVRARIAARPPRLRRRKVLALAFAALALAAAAALAIPPARSAILDFFGLGGVQIERVDQVPATRAKASLALGQPVSLAQARRRVAFPILVPSGDPPDAVYVGASPPGGRVALLWGSRTHPRVLITEFLATDTRRYADKLLGPGTAVELVRVGDAPGLWVHGAAHGFAYVNARGLINFETFRLVGNTLIWQVENRTLRLEADVSKADAITLARSLH